MGRTKATVRRLPTFVSAPCQRIGNKIILNRRNAMLKIKKLLPQVLKRMNVGRKTHYLSGNRRHCTKQL